MKILGLCLLLLVCFAPFSMAQESPASKNDQATIESSPTKPDHIILNLNSEFLPQGATSYCAFMRTYRVKRDRPDSDVVSPAGYSTCVPRKRFEVRNAVEKRTGPAGDK